MSTRSYKWFVFVDLILQRHKSNVPRQCKCLFRATHKDRERFCERRPSHLWKHRIEFYKEFNSHLLVFDLHKYAAIEWNAIHLAESFRCRSKGLLYFCTKAGIEVVLWFAPFQENFEHAVFLSRWLNWWRNCMVRISWIIYRYEAYNTKLVSSTC